MRLWLLKKIWRLLYRKSEFSQYSLKMSNLFCIELHNICIKKKSLRQQLKDGKQLKNLKMVSGLNTADTSEEETLFRNDICEYLWFKNNIMRTATMSSCHIVMQFC